MLFQSIPTKAALNLKAARKQHRSRVKSIENVRKSVFIQSLKESTNSAFFRISCN
jgi:uncharacterized protein Veg